MRQNQYTMRNYFCLIILVIGLLLLACRTSKGQSTAEKEFIFFLHNRFAENNDWNVSHPEFGKVEYNEILDAFNRAGFIVFSEKRPRDTDAVLYARKIAAQIDSLLKTGTKPNHITVIGTSKGGYIAQYVSTYLANPAVNYVFIGSFMPGDIQEYPDIQFCGNILCIYEKSDPFATSAIERKETSRLEIRHFKEIELNTGLKHGFLFKALPDWIEPCKKWARREYGE